MTFQRDDRVRLTSPYRILTENEMMMHAVPVGSLGTFEEYETSHANSDHNMAVVRWDDLLGIPAGESTRRRINPDCLGFDVTDEEIQTAIESIRKAVR